MNSETGANPYQPPKAELQPQGDARSKKPGSTKVLIVVLTMAVLAWSVLYYKVIRQHGWRVVLADQSLLDPVLFGVICWILLLAGKPRKWIYILGSLWLAYMAVTLVWRIVRLDPLLISEQTPLPVIGTLSVLLIYLFYRFTFGLPSRLYYGFAAREEKTADSGAL